MSDERKSQPVHLVVPAYEHLKEADRKKIDAMLEQMKKQRDAGQEITLPSFRSK
jgi:hypothetical protein